jgi:hypothetical protein
MGVCSAVEKGYARKRRSTQVRRYKGDWNKKTKMLVSEYEILVREQNGLCACCKEAPGLTGPDRWGLIIDHDHKTDSFRGLLCHNCNVGLGFFKDNPEKLRQAIVYLEKKR